MSIGTSPVVPPRAYRAQPGAIWTAIVLICATITALAAAFTAFMLYMRPVLKRMESAALATEVASKAMEQSAKEFEQTSLLFQTDTPAMIAEIEAAAAEYRELGHTLNIMTAGFRGKNPVKDWSQLSMKRVAKDVSALTNALSPAMDQWRKRISKIATSFELAHKAEISTAEKQLKTSKARLSQQEEVPAQAIDSMTAKSQEPSPSSKSAAGTLEGLQESGKRLASTAVSLRPSKDASANRKVQSRRNAEAGSLGSASTQQALDLLDVKEAQAGADEINKAADAAEKVTSDVNKLVSELALGSQDGEAVEDAYEQSAASQDLPSMSEEEQALLSQLHTKKQAAESVFRALQRAEHAATAAATASGALEQAMHEAEAQGVLSSCDEVSVSGKQGHSPDRQAPAKKQRRQGSSSQATQGMADSVNPTEMDSQIGDPQAGTNQEQKKDDSELTCPQ